MERQCLMCGKAVRGPKALYCSPGCYPSAFRVGKKEGIVISSGKTGAISELIVSADLIRRGYEVFRSVSQDGSCDLLILRNGKPLRVEVKTAHRHPVNGKIVGMGLKAYQKDFYDVLALVVDGVPVYEPSI